MSNLDNLFPNDDTNGSFDDVTLETLVGENQKYKTADELAKAYANAEAFIARQKAELAEERTRVETLKDIATKTNSNSPEPKPEPKEPVTPPVGNDGIKPERDISEIIREQFSVLNEEQKHKANVNTAAETMKNHFGSADKAKNAILAKAAEMNVSTEWLMDVAARSPESLYKLMDMDVNGRSRSLPGVDVVSDVRLPNTGNGGKKNFRYFEEIRKTNPKLYYSRDIQSQILATAREMGRSFYD